jgi:hypothetical protein
VPEIATLGPAVFDEAFKLVTRGFKSRTDAVIIFLDRRGHLQLDADVAAW